MKYLKHTTRPATAKMGKLWDRLAHLGFSGFTLWWEPIGPALEMAGHSGGYVMEESDGSIRPLGITLADAISGAEVHASFRDAFRPEVSK